MITSGRPLTTPEKYNIKNILLRSGISRRVTLKKVHTCKKVTYFIQILNFKLSALSHHKVNTFLSSTRGWEISILLKVFQKRKFTLVLYPEIYPAELRYFDVLQENSFPMYCFLETANTRG